MKLKFNVLERIMLASILPATFKFADYRILNELKTACAFSEKEQEDLGMTQEGDQINWKVTNSKDKEIMVGKRATEIVVTALKQLDKEEKLSVQLVSLYEKFVVQEETEE